MITQKQFNAILYLICKSETLSTFEKQLCCHLLLASDILTTPVRLTLHTLGPRDNDMMSEYAINIGHGGGMSFNKLFEIANSGFFFASHHGGWDKSGKKIELGDFSLPGNEGDKFCCAFYLSNAEVLFDRNAKIIPNDWDTIAKININPKQFESV